MTTRNLSALFSPASIALIGASNESGSVGAVLARNLLSGGFSGRIMPVNPHEAEIHSVPSFRTLAELPAVPDLAVIATPPAIIPGLIAELGQRGCRAAVVITAGFDPALRAQMLSAARPHLLRIVGPNCLGFLSPVRGINASFSHLAPDAGGIAFLTQSGAIATSMIDWAKGRGVGFSHILSLGDMSDIDFGDLLDFLAADPATASILLYAENVTQARKFMSAGRIAARAKPVIVVKAGRSAAGAKAATSHTGALAGTDAVYDAAFRRAGLLRVDTLRDLFDAAATLATGWRPRGDRLLIVTNGGGLGVLAADELEQRGGQLATLSDASISSLDKVLPRAWSRGNPVDILGDAHGDRYEAALDILSLEKTCDSILIMNCPTGVTDNQEAADAVLRARSRRPQLPWLACWMGEATANAARQRLSEGKLPNYETPDEAIRAFLHLVNHARNQNALLETPSASVELPQAQRRAARRVIEAVLSEGRSILTEPEAKQVLAAYGVPVVETATAATPADAGEAASHMRGPVALKILSRQITHKSDVGGVRLGLEGKEAVVRAADEMLSAVRAKAPEAVVDGFTVQAMVIRPHAHELILGAVVDATFGPCLLFGAGGVATEIIADRVMGLPPLNSTLASDMIARTRVARLLAGYRDRRPAKREAIAAALVSLSDMVIDLPEITELDINPLLADADGVIALDARIVVSQAKVESENRLAIRPYPAELANRIRIHGKPVLVRPIRPDDAAALLELGRRTSATDMRLRFHGAVRVGLEEVATRLSQIDYDREMALVADEAGGSIAGVCRIAFDPEFASAECAIIVRSDTQGRGLGHALLQQTLNYARSRGASRVWGDVLAGNNRMLDLARELGAVCSRLTEVPELVRVEFQLDAS